MARYTDGDCPETDDDLYAHIDRRKATMTKTKTATRIGYVNQDTARGIQVLYRVSPPMATSYRNTGKRSTRYVVSSATTPPWGGLPETCIFPADADGNITSWGELDGSFKGEESPDAAIRNAGYTIIDGKE